MKHADYKAMVHAQDQTHSNAWAYIFQNWHSVNWMSIPTSVKLTLSLHGSIGMCNGQLVTRTGAQGMDACIKWLNRIR